MQLLSELADILRKRNALDAEIAAIISRPAIRSHLGEYIASSVFDIELNASAAEKASDGRFRSGPLAGSSVNVKFLGEQDGLLAIRRDGVPDFYLVMTGPVAPPRASRGRSVPTLIVHVYLFDGHKLVAELTAEGKKLSEATPIGKQRWMAAEVYPESKSALLQVGEEQRTMLRLFGSHAGA
jgi:hypothetical protein